MTPFQLGSLVLLAAVIGLTSRALSRRRLSPAMGVAWLALWMLGAAAIAWPESTARLARSVGIARGADLVSYLAILAMLIGFFVLYLRLKRIETQITLIVREMALRELETKDE